MAIDVDGEKDKHSTAVGKASDLINTTSNSGWRSAIVAVVVVVAVVAVAEVSIAGLASDDTGVLVTSNADSSSSTDSET